MMYVSLCEWRDLQDGHLYNTGDPFPHDGREITADRIDALISGKNRASKPLIKKVKQAPTEQRETQQKPIKHRKTSK